MIYIDYNIITINLPVFPNTPNTSEKKAFGCLPYLLDEDDKLCKDRFGMIYIYIIIKTNNFYNKTETFTINPTELTT